MVVYVMLLQTGPETSDVAAVNVAKNKVTIITAVAKHKDPGLSVEARRGELMESNMDAMEVTVQRLSFFTG